MIINPDTNAESGALETITVNIKNCAQGKNGEYITITLPSVPTQICGINLSGGSFMADTMYLIAKAGSGTPMIMYGSTVYTLRENLNGNIYSLARNTSGPNLTELDEVDTGYICYI